VNGTTILPGNRFPNKQLPRISWRVKVNAAPPLFLWACRQGEGFPLWGERTRRSFFSAFSAIGNGLHVGKSEYIIEAVTEIGGCKMPELQIPDLDQKTMSFLRVWAADHGRTIEDEARFILQRTVAEAEIMPSDGGAAQSIRCADEARNGVETAQSRGALSLQPMTLSAEDAAIMEETWQTGLARPKIGIVPLPEYEG
jgi:plasmid stability protein